MESNITNSLFWGVKNVMRTLARLKKTFLLCLKDVRHKAVALYRVPSRGGPPPSVTGRSSSCVSEARHLTARTLVTSHCHRRFPCTTVAGAALSLSCCCRCRALVLPLATASAFPSRHGVIHAVSFGYRFQLQGFVGHNSVS